MRSDKLLGVGERANLSPQSPSALLRLPVPATRDETALRRYGHQLWQGKWMVAACVFAGLCLQGFSSFRRTPMYRAESRVVINQEDSNLSPQDVIYLMSEEDTDEDDLSLDTAVSLLRSDALALQVIQKMSLDANSYFGGSPLAPPSDRDPEHAPAVAEVGMEGDDSDLEEAPETDFSRQQATLDAFHGGLSVSPVKGTRMLRIGFLSPDPRLSAGVANTVAATFIELEAKARRDLDMETSRWIARQLEDLRLKAEAAEEKLARYQRRANIIGIDERENILTAHLEGLDRQLTRAQTERLGREARSWLMRSGSPELTLEAAGDSTVIKLEERKAALRQQLAQTGAQFGPAYPKVRALSRQLQQVQTALGDEYSRIGARTEREYEAAIAREGMLSGAVENQKRAVNRLNQQAIAYGMLKHEADTSRSLYGAMLQELKETAITSELREDKARLVDEARAPLSPATPSLQTDLAFAFFPSLLSGAGLVLLLGARSHIIHDADDVQRIAALPSLATVPMESGGALAGAYRRKPWLSAGHDAVPIETISLTQPGSEIAESYRGLGTLLLHASEPNSASLGAPDYGIGEPWSREIDPASRDGNSAIRRSECRTILVTSALPQEGKTTTSINLAIVLAQRGERVLLIDADMRHPGIHRHFRIANAHGLSELLAGTAKPHYFTPVRLPKLYVLPAGTPPPYPAERLASAMMRQLLTESWPAEFDHIIIDSPPALAVTDAVVLATEVDSVLLVARAGYTGREMLRRTFERLQQVNAPLSGVVLNAVDLASAYPRYYDSFTETYRAIGPITR